MLNKHLGFVLCSRANLKEARRKRGSHCNASKLILFCIFVFLVSGW